MRIWKSGTKAPSDFRNGLPGSGHAGGGMGFDLGEAVGEVDEFQAVADSQGLHFRGEPAVKAEPEASDTVGITQ